MKENEEVGILYFDRLLLLKSSAFFFSLKKKRMKNKINHYAHNFGNLCFYFVNHILIARLIIVTLFVFLFTYYFIHLFWF